MQEPGCVDEVIDPVLMNHVDLSQVPGPWKACMCVPNVQSRPSPGRLASYPGSLPGARSDLGGDTCGAQVLVGWLVLGSQSRRCVCSTKLPLRCILYFPRAILARES